MLSNSRAGRIGFNLPKCSLKPCFQKFFPGVKQVPPIQTNKSRVGWKPRWERQEDSQQHKLLGEWKQTKGSGGPGQGHPPYRLTQPRPWAPGRGGGAGPLPGMNTPLLSLCPSILQYLSALEHSRPLSLWEFYCSYLTAALNWFLNICCILVFSLLLYNWTLHRARFLKFPRLHMFLFLFD